MLRHTILIFTIICLYCGLSFAKPQKKEVMVVVPIQHQALNDITTGFREGLLKFYTGPVTIKIYNAQGDNNVQNAIIQQGKQQQNINLVVSIATTTLQTAAAIIDNKPILGLAATYTEKERLSRKTKNLTVLQDEIAPKHILAFIKKLFPNIKKITVIHSNTPKIQYELNIFKKLCKKTNIEVQKLLVPTLMDLYSISRSIDKNTDIVFILKDNIIASGIQTLNQQVKKLKIPLVTSDEGTVKQGADIALGVTEKDIGTQGAKIAAKILEGQDISKMPVQFMKNLKIFYNEKK